MTGGLRQSVQRQKLALSLRIAALILGFSAICVLFLPILNGVFNNVSYTLNGYQLLTASLRVNGATVSLPFSLRFALAGVLLCSIAGGILLICKKAMVAGGVFAAGAFCAIMLLSGGASLQEHVASVGVDNIDLTMQAGFFLALTLPLLAAALSLLSTGVQSFAKSVFLAAACVSIGAVAFICIYMVLQGAPAILQIGLKEFLFSTDWSPTAKEPSYGIAYMVLASVFGTAGAVLLGVPIGLLTAVFLAELAPRWLRGIVRPAVELLAGIPSVIFGFFGMRVIVPFLRDLFPNRTNGDSLLAVILILAMMILPTIINVAQNALEAVPVSYKEASLALGNTHIGTIFKVQIPAARSGILAGVILGVGRAIGETMAIIMVAGNTVSFPHLFGAVRPLTSGIAFEMGYATGLHKQALFGIGLVLFLFLMVINVVFTWVSKKGVGEGEK